MNERKKIISQKIAWLSEFAPSLRVCQLISNAVIMKYPKKVTIANGGTDLYNITDDELEEALDAYKTTLIEMDK